MSKKEVHKESLERLKETEKVLAGWMTKYQIAKLEGESHEFKELADTVVQGLEERPHEVSAWAQKGMKQYKVSLPSKVWMTLTTKTSKMSKKLWWSSLSKGS